MKIKKIEIKNVKGIQHQSYIVDLLPNKPNIFVAPNGYGKSSFSIGFDSLKPNKLELDDKHHHMNNSANLPEIQIEIDDSGTVKTLLADNTQNTISDEFDIFVINSQLTAKAKILNINGTRIAKSSLEIEKTVLVNTVPQNKEFGYNFTVAKKVFSETSGKILPNITQLLNSSIFLDKLESTIDFSRFELVGNLAIINNALIEIKAQTGTAQQIKNWILLNKLPQLVAIAELKKLASLIQAFDNTIISEVDSFLASFQIINLKKTLGAEFKKAIKYTHYLSEKDEFEKIINTVNSTRIRIKPKEDGNKLIVEWPKAHEISNGQRDVLSFITLLLLARKHLNKQNCILIIDEIFDYLDDANLIAFQYFITSFIDELKAKGKNFFPILMTHLDPLFFNHFCFNRHKLKVVYLKDVPYLSNPNILALIRKREDPTIQAVADKHHFHFYPTTADISTEFGALGLPQTWGKSEKFHNMINSEVVKYLNNQTDFDPLAICFAVRVKIESLLYDKIADPAHQIAFLSEHGTKKKLEYCETLGVVVPETYYLLGIIYNEKLHWRNGMEIIRPVAIKLENITIKKMITDIIT